MFLHWSLTNIYFYHVNRTSTFFTKNPIELTETYELSWQYIVCTFLKSHNLQYFFLYSQNHLHIARPHNSYLTMMWLVVIYGIHKWCTKLSASMRAILKIRFLSTLNTLGILLENLMMPDLQVIEMVNLKIIFILEQSTVNPFNFAAIKFSILMVWNLIAIKICLFLIVFICYNDE